MRFIISNIPLYISNLRTVFVTVCSRAEIIDLMLVGKNGGF